MTRIARCYCGALRAEVTGEPWIVAICARAGRMALPRRRQPAFRGPINIGPAAVAVAIGLTLPVFLPHSSIKVKTGPAPL